MVIVMVKRVNLYELLRRVPGALCSQLVPEEGILILVLWSQR